MIEMLLVKVEELEGKQDNQGQQLATLMDLTAQAKGALRLGNWMMGTLGAVFLTAIYWGVGSITAQQLKMQEQSQRLLEVSNLLQAHGQLEFHASAYPTLRQMETDLTTLRIVLQRMDEEQKRRFAR